MHLMSLLKCAGIILKRHLSMAKSFILGLSQDWAGYVLSLVELDGPLGFLFGFCPGIAKGGDL